MLHELTNMIIEVIEYMSSFKKFNNRMNSLEISQRTLVNSLKHLLARGLEEQSTEKILFC